MNENDLRVIKTKNALFNALIELMKDKTFEEIKVSDICNKALINRSTFYAHFDDKYDLLSKCINDLKESLTNKLQDNKKVVSTKEYYLEMIKLFLDFIDEKKEQYLAIAKSNRNSILFDIIYDVVDKDIMMHLQNDAKVKNNNIPNEIIGNFYMGAVGTVAITWIRNINKYTKEDIIAYLDNLIPNKID